MLTTLAKEPEKRYRNARQLSEALETSLAKTCLESTTSFLALAAKQKLRPGPHQPTAAATRQVGPMALTAKDNELEKVLKFLVLLAFVGLILGLGGGQIGIGLTVFFGSFAVALGLLANRKLLETIYSSHALISAAANGRVKRVQGILKRGTALDGKDDLGETALMKAAESGHASVVKVLIVNGADVNLKEPFGQSALTKAAAKRHHDIVELLKKAGAVQ